MKLVFSTSNFQILKQHLWTKVSGKGLGFPQKTANPLFPCAACVMRDLRIRALTSWQGIHIHGCGPLLLAPPLQLSESWRMEIIAGRWQMATHPWFPYGSPTNKGPPSASNLEENVEMENMKEQFSYTQNGSRDSESRKNNYSP